MSRQVSKRIVTFQAEPDVNEMLNRATKEGAIVLAALGNRSLRQYLTAKGYARKSDPKPKKW